MLASVCFVLLIACVNVRTCQFARATGALARVAVRTALGAGTRAHRDATGDESILLALAGAALDCWWRTGNRTDSRRMRQRSSATSSEWKEMRLDGRALAFTLAAALSSRHPGGPGRRHGRIRGPI